VVGEAGEHVGGGGDGVAAGEQLIKEARPRRGGRGAQERHHVVHHGVERRAARWQGERVAARRLLGGEGDAHGLRDIGAEELERVDGEAREGLLEGGSAARPRGGDEDRGERRVHGTSGGGGERGAGGGAPESAAVRLWATCAPRAA